MSMFTHIVLGSNDIARSTAFYDAALGALGIDNMGAFREGSMVYGKNGAFGLLITTPANGQPACHANGGTVGLAAETSAQVDAFHAAGIANGGTSEGEPGPRSMPKSYGAYLRDPDGNKLCAFSFDHAG